MLRALAARATRLTAASAASAPLLRVALRPTPALLRCVFVCEAQRVWLGLFHCLLPVVLQLLCRCGGCTDAGGGEEGHGSRLSASCCGSTGCLGCWHAQVQERIMNIFRLYDKVDAGKVGPAVGTCLLQLGSLLDADRRVC